MNTTLKLLENRFSLRKYADNPITDEDLDLIIDAAIGAPTAGNMMMYSIIVVKDQEKKNTLSKTCDNQPFIANAPVILIFVADYKRWYDYYNFSNVKEFCANKNISFTAPDASNLLLAASDALIAAENAVVAAESLSIGSCYIGDIMEKFETHKELLKLPEYAFPVAMLCMGYYPDNIIKKDRVRFKKDYIVFNEEYRTLSHEEIIDMFSDREKFYFKENKYGAENYAQMHYSFKTGADFSIEMARSVKEALKQWNGKKLWYYLSIKFILSIYKIEKSLINLWLLY